MSSDPSAEPLESEDSKDSTSTEIVDQKSGGRSLRTRQASKQSTDGAVTPVPVEARVRTRLKSMFLEDFNPEESTRERRKQTRKPYAAVSKSILNELGRYRESGADVCDCLDTGCVGCHFPCPNCGNTKCGFACRVNRKWVVESIEYDGKDLFHENGNTGK